MILFIQMDWILQIDAVPIIQFSMLSVFHSYKKRLLRIAKLQYDRLVRYMKSSIANEGLLRYIRTCQQVNLCLVNLTLSLSCDIHVYLNN